MKVRVKNNSGGSLEYTSPGACAFDFRAVEDVVFAPGEWKLVETGVVVAIPEGYCLMISPRSGTFKNYGLMQVNSVGIIDQDYCGDNDTIKFGYINMRKEETRIEKGDRIGQGMFVRIEKPEFEFVDKMGDQDRGGFGASGKK